MTDFSSFKPENSSLLKRLCLKIAEIAFCETQGIQSRDAEISLARRAMWLCKELNLPYSQQCDLVHRIEYEGVHIQMVQVSESATNVTMHFPSVGEDGKYLQCSWAFVYSKFTSFCSITAAIQSAVIMADKYYGAPDENN